MFAVTSVFWMTAIYRVKQAPLNDETAFDVDNISNFLTQSPQSNIKNRQIFDLSKQKYDFNDKSLHLFLHVNSSSL